MDKICGIYKITSPTERVYIGQSIDINKRFVYYRRMACKNQTKLYRSFLKHGVENHTFEIIHECELSKIDVLEKAYIAMYNSYNTICGLNLRSGGANGLHSEVTKKKLSVRAMGRTHSDEARAKMRIGQSKRPIMSAETKEKHRISALGKNKGKKHTLETRMKMAQASTGRKHTEEFKEQLRIRNIGNKHNVGKKHSDETLAKMKASASKRILHPSLNAYDKRGCRCNECRAIKSEYCRNRYKKLKELKSAERHKTTSLCKKN